jgi:hypothetical protein
MGEKNQKLQGRIIVARASGILVLLAGVLLATGLCLASTERTKPFVPRLTYTLCVTGACGNELESIRSRVLEQVPFRRGGRQRRSRCSP